LKVSQASCMAARTSFQMLGAFVRKACSWRARRSTQFAGLFSSSTIRCLTFILPPEQQPPQAFLLGGTQCAQLVM
jgi:hypothetical protein